MLIKSRSTSSRTPYITTQLILGTRYRALLCCVLCCYFPRSTTQSIIWKCSIKPMLFSVKKNHEMEQKYEIKAAHIPHIFFCTSQHTLDQYTTTLIHLCSIERETNLVEFKVSFLLSSYRNRFHFIFGISYFSLSLSLWCAFDLPLTHWHVPSFSHPSRRCLQ